MKINEDNILDDMGRIYSLTSNPSYSKDKKYCDDIFSMNYLYAAVYNKYFNLPNIYNPYYDRFSDRSMKKDFIEFEGLISDYKYFYLESAENYLKMLEENNFFHAPRKCKQSYTTEEIKELMLDFFNDEDADKYKIVKSMFDDERVGVASLEDLGCEGFCVSMSSGVRPYVVIKKTTKNLNLMHAMNLAHEFGHCVENHFALNRHREYCSGRVLSFREVSSMFYQIEFLRYLEKNRINIKDTTNLINYSHRFTQSYLIDLKNSDTDKLKIDGEDFVSANDDFYLEYNRNIVRPFKSESDEDDEVYWLELDFFNPLLYGFGSYLAMHLSELKKQDPKEFKKAWNYYLSSRTLMSYEDIFNLFNLDPYYFASGKIIEPTIKKDLGNYKKLIKRQL